MRLIVKFLMTAFREEEKDRLLAALEKIAENTTPVHDDIAELSGQRSKLRNLLASSATFITQMAQVFEIAQEEPDMMIRSRDMRAAIQKLRDNGKQYKAMVDGI